LLSSLKWNLALVGNGIGGTRFCEEPADMVVWFQIFKIKIVVLANETPAVVVWSCWKLRNGVRFEGKLVDGGTLTDQIKRRVIAWLSSIGNNLDFWGGGDSGGVSLMIVGGVLFQGIEGVGLY
ncbi:hypothetical protein Dimus_002584, partial [Dionaea muscipula]